MAEKDKKRGDKYSAKNFEKYEISSNLARSLLFKISLNMIYLRDNLFDFRVQRMQFSHEKLGKCQKIM